MVKLSTAIDANNPKISLTRPLIGEGNNVSLAGMSDFDDRPTACVQSHMRQSSRWSNSSIVRDSHQTNSSLYRNAQQ
jgi:hypothetical protein